MKHIIYTLLITLFIITSCKKDKSSEQATFITETLNLIHCESAVYNSEKDIIYASQIGKKEPGDGAIATVSIDGKLINAKFVEGLNDPKGIVITKDKLYVSDVTELVEVDLATGKIIKKHTTEGTKFLNDVAVDVDGSVYVSDTATSEIYKLDSEGNFGLWLADAKLDEPNGLLIQNNIMYVASWGTKPEGGAVSKIDMATKSIETISSVIGNLDGIRPYDENNMIISDWSSGKIHLIDYNGKTKEILQVDKSVGDIAYIQDKKLLLLPMNKQNRLLFYKFK